MKILFLKLKSNIIKNNKNELILSWLKKKTKKFNLLMDARIYGDSNSTFYEKCGKKCPIMIFITTTDEYRFGG